MLVAVLLVFVPASLGASPTRGGTQPQPTQAVASALDCEFYNCFTLTVLPLGSGTGTVQSTTDSHVPDGFINCRFVNGSVTAGSVCSKTRQEYPDVNEIKVNLLMSPDVGSTLCYRGFCQATAYFGSYYIPVGATVTVAPEFKLLAYPVAVTFPASGTGFVAFDPGGLTCPPMCSNEFLFGTTVTLTATAFLGWYVAGWTGPCAGQDASCVLVVPAHATLTSAIFASGTPPPSAAPATLKPAATPRQTAGANPTAAATQGPSATAVGSPAGPSATVASEASPSAEATFVEPSPAVTNPPTDPAVATSSDFTPIVLAILGAGLLIAIGLAFVGFNMRKRPGGSGPT